VTLRGSVHQRKRAGYQQDQISAGSSASDELSFSGLHQDAPGAYQDRAPWRQEPRSSSGRVSGRRHEFEALLVAKQRSTEGVPLLGRLEGFEERSRGTVQARDRQPGIVRDLGVAKPYDPQCGSNPLLSNAPLRSSNLSRRDTSQPTRGIRPSWVGCQEQAGRPGNASRSPSQESKSVPSCHSRVYKRALWKALMHVGSEPPG